MIGPVFVDTNVFVYLHDESEPEKKLRADDWIAFLVGHRSGRLSRNDKVKVTRRDQVKVTHPGLKSFSLVHNQ